ncbi:hypothetical protein [Methylobrevis albus]|uniref:GIY-YIG domain-containing protein n=1 Tax=Methylobrevis albus TaxID=2793297 RepID=A0A931I3D4_9HYPH|nr:hypothetical protein [Methylobrevis albus]MBH0238531.1 hypothetical protein [Methylobrevis albus]
MVSIVINWTDEFDFDGLKKDRYSTERGVYQIIERGFGRQKLIYIGLVKGVTRSFYMRMNEHRKDWINGYYYYRYYVKFGIISRLDRRSVTDELIEDAESVLIFEHQPPQNTSKIRICRLAADLSIVNENRGPFLTDRQLQYATL